jgi:hypothetical protein
MDWSDGAFEGGRARETTHRRDDGCEYRGVECGGVCHAFGQTWGHVRRLQLDPEI